MAGTIQQFQIFLLRLWRQWITLDCEMPSSPDTLQVLLYGFEHILRIHCFRPTWPCPIVEVLTTRVKFLHPSDYCTFINCTFTFYTTSIFGCFLDVMVGFQLVKYNLKNFREIKFDMKWVTLKPSNVNWVVFLGGFSVQC